MRASGRPRAAVRKMHTTSPMFEEIRYLYTKHVSYFNMTASVSDPGIHFKPVLWIRIRNNPNVLAGSESESEKKFGFGTD
jgi:hypothetical protein